MRKVNLPFKNNFAFGLCLSLSFIFYQLPATAQLAVGVEGGYNKNYLVTNNANRSFTYYQPMNGFTVGIPLQYKITDWFAVATDPTFIKKNYQQQRSAFFIGVYQQNYNSYLQLPLMAHFMFGGEKLKGFLNAGVYGGYWVASKVKGKMPNILDIPSNDSATASIYDYENPYSYNQKYTFDKRKDNQFEAGWIGGIGLAYDVTSRYQVFAEGRILYSFTDQQKNYMINQLPRYNTTVGINAGILINLTTNENSY